MSDDARLSYLKSSMQVSHEENVAKKIQKVSAVRDMYNNKYSIRAIARELIMSSKTITKYLDDNFSAINGNYNVKKKSVLDPFLEEINKLIDKNYTSSEIENIIRQEGYRGSDSSIRHYRSRLKRLIYETHKNSGISPAKTELVERYKLLKLLYNPVTKIKGLSSEYVNKVNTKYPKYKEIIDLVGDFRTIFKNKATSKINNWIQWASYLNNRYINSFINGLTRDITAVKNAITYDYNNGLAEGSVNKLKVVKRIMYGRNSFDMLYKKILWLEKRRAINLHWKEPPKCTKIIISKCTFIIINYCYFSYFPLILPSQKSHSSHTLKSYRYALALYIGFLETEKGISPERLFGGCFSRLIIEEWLYYG